MACTRCDRANARISTEADELRRLERGALLQCVDHVLVQHGVCDFLVPAAPAAAGRGPDWTNLCASALGHGDEGELARRAGAVGLVGGAVDDVDGPGEDVARVDGRRGRGEGHCDAEVGDGGLGAVRGGFQRGEGVWADGRGGFQVGDDLGDAADGELRRAVGALDAGFRGGAETRVDGQGEVEGGGPAHGEARGADARDDEDGGGDGDFEASRGVSGEGGLGLLGLDVVEERDVIVGNAAQGKAEAGFVIEVLDGAVGGCKSDAVQEGLAFKVGGEVDFQEGDDAPAQGYRVGARESYSRMQDWKDLDAQLGQCPEACHEVLLPRDGGHSRYSQRR